MQINIILPRTCFVVHGLHVAISRLCLIAGRVQTWCWTNCVATYSLRGVISMLGAGGNSHLLLQSDTSTFPQGGFFYVCLTSVSFQFLLSTFF